jgi:hypothetical protein
VNKPVYNTTEDIKAKSQLVPGSVSCLCLAQINTC